MDETEFYNCVTTLRQDASSRGAAIEIVENAPASPSAILECSARLGVTFPGELVSFLRWRNGLAISYYEDASIAKAMPDAWSERLEIQGTTGISILTQAVREFFSDVAAASPSLASMRRRLDGMVILESEADLITYVRTDDERASSSMCPVRTFDQQRYSDWLMAPEGPIIAPSIAEHVIRSIKAMIRTKNTFMYWNPMQ